MQLTRKAVATLAAMSMVAMLSALDQTVVSTALPHILTSLPGAALLGWIFTAYFVGATATVAVVGKLTDLFGRRPVFLISIALFSAASLACGIAIINMILRGGRRVASPRATLTGLKRI